MTLINYINRVHFADNVLEEALWAELDQRKGRHVLVLTDPDLMEGEIAERFRAGLPAKKRAHVFARHLRQPTEAAALELAAAYRARDCATIVAFGPGPVIDLAKAVRLLVSQSRPLAELAVAEGGTTRISAAMPDMIAVPTLGGLAAGLGGQVTIRLADGRWIDMASPDLVPTVTICDPVLTLAATEEAQASAGVAALACCVEALMSPNFNPPAEGIAQDGVARALISISPPEKSRSLDLRRQLMAAGLDAALVQQKGHGLAHAMACAIDAVAADAMDRGAVARLLLPEILGFYEAAGLAVPKALLDGLGLPCGGVAADMLRQRLSGLPLPRSLAEMGLGAEDLERAAAIALGHRAVSNGPRIPKRQDILAILHSVR